MSVTTGAPAPVFDVKLSFGPMLIGVFLNMILYGVLINQAYFYFQTYKSDAGWIQILVVYLFVIETANTAIDMAMMYQPLIAGYGTQQAVENFPTLFMTEPIIIVLISTPIQCFFAWRIQKITNTYWIPIVIVVLSMASTAGGFITGVKIAIIKLFIKKPELHWPALLWFLPSCAADLLITATLVRGLSQRKTGFTTTDSMIDKLIRLTVQTGMLTAICAIGDVIFFLVLPHTALNFLWDLSLSKLYTNCLMSTLNARATLLNGTQHANVSSAGRNPSSSRDAYIRRQRFVGNSQHDTSSIMSAPQLYYELENAKTLEAASGTSPRGHRIADPESGITVTKVYHRKA
ncbi:hypothetical protein BT96DRAFT_612723 [Gymnopus androsaceus JB14]|uniref:DUF6534 domain-containing protein n=1 Tax=Gymnopus androsaceus JB14 TaxID=1447944 RepID=A0A6A4HWB0_9AGAR|nr:hypothetical protein BT96DRAFT_612723 [Gymnopus androsaceus JB14]